MIPKRIVNIEKIKDNGFLYSVSMAFFKDNLFKIIKWYREINNG